MLELEYLVKQISAFSGHQVKSAFQRCVCDTLPPKSTADGYITGAPRSAPKTRDKWKCGQDKSNFFDE